MNFIDRDQLRRQRGLKGCRLRKRRAKRMSAEQLRGLGLQAHVGVERRDVERASFYAMLERVIAREASQAKLTPLMSIGFDGRPRTEELVDLVTAEVGSIELGKDEERPVKVLRNTSATPLDYLYFQAKSRLEHWEWVTGKRFEYDHHRARGEMRLTVDISLLKRANISREERRRLAEMTFKPRRRRDPRQFSSSPSDARIDAQARLGRLADEVSNISFWLLEQVIGREVRLKDVAQRLDVDQGYISQRFREALWEAAGHYRLAPSSKPRSRR